MFTLLANRELEVSLLFRDWWFKELEIVFFMVAYCFLLLSRVLLLPSDLSLRKLFLFEFDLFCWS